MKHDFFNSGTANESIDFYSNILTTNLTNLISYEKNEKTKIKEYRELKESIINILKEHNNTVSKIYFNNVNNSNIVDKIINSIFLIKKTFEDGKNIFLIGNGGSAADCQHLAAEFISIGYPAISLTTDTSVLTSIGNDFGFNQLFSIQLSTLGKEKDLLIVISTSGNSANILEAIEIAKKKGMKIIGLTSRNGGKLKYLLNSKSNNTEILIQVPSDNTQRIQELHITIGHIIFEILKGTNEK